MWRTPLDVPFPGATNGTQAYGINNKGQVVGGYGYANGEVHGFLYADGVFTPFDVPRANNTVLYAINDQGLLVGEYDVDSSSRWHGFLYADGQFTTLAVPFEGATATHPYGVNNQGQVVGNYWTTAERYHGFLYEDGIYTPIDVPQAVWTLAYEINQPGQIVGQSVDQSGGHGFLYDDGAFTLLDAPHAQGTIALGVNDLRQIVGIYSDERSQHGFLATPQKK
jgi:probable HAF family extracellular repeat protein